MSGALPAGFVLDPGPGDGASGLPAGFQIDAPAAQDTGPPAGFVLDSAPAAPAATANPSSSLSARFDVNAGEGFRGLALGSATERVRAGQTGSQAGAAALVAANEAARDGSEFGLEQVGGQPSPYAGIPVARLRALGEESLRRGAAASEDFNTRVLPERRAEEAAIGPWNQGSLGERVVQGGTALLGQIVGGMASPESFIGPAGQVGRMGRLAVREGTGAAAEGAGAYVVRQAAESGVPNAVVAGAVDPLVQQGEIERGTRQEYDPLATAFAAALGGVIGTGVPVSVEAARTAYGAISRRRAAAGQPPPRMDGSDVSPEEAAAALREFSDQPAPPPAEVPLRPVQDVPEPPALAAPPRLLEAPDARTAGDVAEPAGVPDVGLGRPVPDRAGADDNLGGLPGDGEVPGGALRPLPEEVAPPIRPDPESVSGPVQPFVSRETPIGDTQPALRLADETQQNPLPGRVATDVVPGRAAGREPPPAGVRPVGEGPDVRVDQEAPAPPRVAESGGFRVESDGGDRYRISAGGEQVGRATLIGPPGARYLEAVEIAPTHRGRGQALYDAIERASGERLGPSPLGLSPQATALWARRLSRLSDEEVNALLDRMKAAGVEIGARPESIEARFAPLRRQPQQGAPDAAPAAPMPSARSPDAGQTNVQPPASRAGAPSGVEFPELYNPPTDDFGRRRADAIQRMAAEMVRLIRAGDVEALSVRARVAQWAGKDGGASREQVDALYNRVSQEAERADNLRRGIKPDAETIGQRSEREARERDARARAAPTETPNGQNLPSSAEGATAPRAGAPPGVAPQESAWQRYAEERASRMSDDPGLLAGQRDSFLRGYRTTAVGAENAKFSALGPNDSERAANLFRNLGKRGRDLNMTDFLAGRDAGRERFRTPKPETPSAPPARADDAGAARPAGDDAPAGRPDTGGEGASRSGDEAPPLYSTPLDPAAIKRFLTDPITNSVRSLRNRLRDTTAAKAFSTLFDSNRGALFVLRDRFPNSQALAKLIDHIATDPGTGRVVKGTYQTEVTSHAVGLTNRAVNVLGPSTGVDRAVRDALATGRTTNPDVAVKASRIRNLLDEQRAFMRESGVEVGEQKNYFPREYDEHTVAASRDDFLRDAAAEYEKTGLDATEAHNAAVAFFERITRVTMPGWTPDTIGPTSTKARVLPASADDALARYMITDPRDVLARYFLRTTREAEFTRRFGKNGAEVTKWFEQMRRDGIPATEVDRIRDHFASSVGALSRPGSSALQTAGDWIQTAGIVARLTGATISSLPEALAVGVRTGNPLRGLEAFFFDPVRAILSTNDRRMHRQLAEWFGIIGTHGPDAVMASQAGADARPGTMPSRINDGLFKLNLLHQLTSHQRVTATRHGALFVKHMAEDVAGGASTRRSAERLLGELGMTPDDARAVDAWLKTNPDMPTMAGDSAQAQSYRTAVTRFVNETIQNPEPVDKPMWASSPVGRLAYGITSFQYAFTRNVIMRSVRQANAAVSAGDLGLADRFRLAGALPALAVLFGAQWAVSEARDKLGNRQQRREQEPWIQTVANLDRLGVFMNLSPIVNMAMGARYQSDPSSRLAGPYVSNITNTLKALLGTLPQSAGGPNSPRTNNAENTMARTVYASVLAPSVIAALALAPLPAPVRAAAGVAAIAATRPDANRAFANAVAGPPTVRARTAGNRNPGRTLGR